MRRMACCSISLTRRTHRTGNDPVELWAYLIGIPAALVLIPYLLGPILVKATQKLPARPELRVIDPQEDLPPEVHELFGGAIATLGAQGFSEMSFLLQEGHIAGQTVHMCTFANPRTNELAVATYIRQKEIRCPFVEYVTRFEDRSSVTTNNSTQVNPLAMLPHKRLVQLPGLADLRTLYAAHHAAVGEGARPRVRPAPAAGGLKALVIESMIEVYDEQCGVGYLYQDEAAAAYRFTWKGALLMTWQLCWPVKGILESRTKARGEALLMRHGLA